jgi:hypothetical protein
MSDTIKGKNIGIAVAKNSTINVHQYDSNDKQSDILDVADELQLILGDLAQKHPNLAKSRQSTDESVKQDLLKTELKEKMDNNSDFKARFSRALKAGADGLVKAFESNPFISVPLSVVKAWFFNN